MKIGVLKELSPETRVSLLPEHILTLKKWGVEVTVENNAGASAFANDDKYLDAGAMIASARALPASMMARASGMEHVQRSRPPAARSCIAGAAPFEGTQPT